TGDHIRGHERMSLVGLPPAPAAVFVLEVVETLEAGMDLLLKRRFVQILFQSELSDRLLDNNVRKESRHGLFDATVRERSQVIECAKQRARDGRRHTDDQ